MIDVERLKEQKTFTVFSWRIAEKLVFKYGLRELIAIERSNRDARKRVYIFFSNHELINDFQQMVEELSEMNNDRRNVEREYYNILESADEEPFEEPEPEIIDSAAVISVDDSDILGEESALPKKRGRKKKETIDKE